MGLDRPGQREREGPDRTAESLVPNQQDPRRWRSELCHIFLGDFRETMCPIVNF